MVQVLQQATEQLVLLQVLLHTMLVVVVGDLTRKVPVVLVEQLELVEAEQEAAQAGTVQEVLVQQTLEAEAEAAAGLTLTVAPLVDLV